MTATDAHQDRLAAAARALAAAEEAAAARGRHEQAPSGEPVAPVEAVELGGTVGADAAAASSRVGSSPSRTAGARWADGAFDEVGGQPLASTHLELSPLQEEPPHRGRRRREQDEGQRSGDRSGDRSGQRSGERRRQGRGRRRPPPPSDPSAQGDEPDAESVARSIVLRQLTMGPRTRQQLADKLRQRGCDDEVAQAVLDRMADVGLIDDQAYADMLVRSRQVGKGLAKRALAQELRTKGVDDEIVAEALGSVDPESERIRAEELAAKKMRSMGGLDPQVQARRLSGMLARKGYPPGVVYAVVRDAVNGAPEHQRD